MKKVESKGTAKTDPKNPEKDSIKGRNTANEGMASYRATLSSERYRAFVENIEEGIYELDIHGNFLYFNNSLCKIFGYSKEEIQFQSFSKFMDEEHAKKATEAFGRMYQTGKGLSDLVWQILTKGGDSRIIELSANPIFNKENEIIGFRGIARDITERFRAQEALRKSERRYRTFLDFIPYPMVVFNLDGRVFYLNPAFTEVFGWTLEELEGKKIPYVPPGFEKQTTENIKKLLQTKRSPQVETKRLTKDGRILDIVMAGAVYSERRDETGGQLVILRDITREKRMARHNDALQRISMALPKYPELDDLLDYISEEVKRLLEVEGALVILLDEEKNELFFKSAALDDSDTEERMKEIRFPAKIGIAGKVIRTGESLIVPDTSKDPVFHSVVDIQAGFKTRNMLDVPLRSRERIIGVLCAMNKNKGVFDDTDVEFLNMIASTVALSIDNARFSSELKAAYQEVTSLNRAKDKVINHLSHELKTPLAVLGASLNSLEKRLAPVPEETWSPTIERARRNLDRILEVQYQVEDIMRERYYETHHVMSLMLEECADELMALVSEEAGEGHLVERIGQRIEEIFGPKESLPVKIVLGDFVKERLKVLRPLFSHRQLEIEEHLNKTPHICMPIDSLQKVVDGLIKNAIENTPDEGKINLSVQKRGKGTEFIVQDYGVGITEENRRRIFEGFFTTQETMDYSSKRPFDFNAGGKGADLLRMKIFSERYGFKISMTSSRCGFIPKASDVCPGRISNCSFCKQKDDCYGSGGTTFTLFFPAAREDEC